MPYFLESDDWADDPTFGVLAKGKLPAEDALRASHQAMKSRASHIRRDGYLTAAAALEACRGRRWVLDLLCTAVLEQPPLVHRQGDECACLGDRWVEGFDYRIHQFLKRNPSRAENDREKEKRADRRNTPLKAAVYDRDGGHCRYCMSGPLHPKAGRAKDHRRALQHDHVDPDRAAGPDASNYVTACRACNEYKGQRTPYEAGMVLLPVPSPQEAKRMLKAAPKVLDRPVYDLAQLSHNTDANLGAITAGSATDQRQNTDRITDSDTDRDLKPATDPNATTAANPAHEQAPGQAEQQHGGVREPHGSGRGGQPAGDRSRRAAADPFAQPPARESGSPDIYTRRGRPLPVPPDPIIWNPGEQAGRPPQQRDGSTS